MKCPNCKKKSMTMIECRCKSKICLRCKDDHKCTYDYKTCGRETIAKNNPKVVSEKITKI